MMIVVYVLVIMLIKIVMRFVLVQPLKMIVAYVQKVILVMRLTVT